MGLISFCIVCVVRKTLEACLFAAPKNLLGRVLQLTD
jgi:hypothetical protein